MEQIELDRLERAHPASSDISWVATYISGSQGAMLRNLFRISLTNPDQWVHWKQIKTAILDRGEFGNGDADSNDVNKLAKRLKGSLDGFNFSKYDWKARLLCDPQKPDGSNHFRLIVERCSRQNEHNMDTVLPPSNPKPFAPEFVWQGDGPERRLPVWLPFDLNSSLDFSINLCAEWAKPPLFPDYDELKVNRWKQTKTTIRGDTPICSFRGYRKLATLTSGISPVVIDTTLADYSDFNATNQQIMEWQNTEGENSRVRELKSKLGPDEERTHFPVNAANPVSITVILLTKDKKIVFLKDAERWDSPVWDFLNPFQDVQRTCPFGLSPHETAIRSAYQNLAISVQRQSVDWIALALHRETGIVNLLGEMSIDLEAKQIELHVNKWRGNVLSHLAFIELNPEAIFNFFKSSKTWPRHILEVSLALFLNRRFPNKVKTFTTRQ